MALLMGCLVLVGLWLFVMVYRAVSFKPKEEEMEAIHIAACNTERASQHLAEMLQVETISRQNPDESNASTFEDFKALLVRQYPLIHSQCERSFHGPTGILYKWHGRRPTQSPTLFMSHYDVVPVESSMWSVAPFSGLIADGYVWGRGALDTKGTLCSILEAAEALIEEGFTPEEDIYFSFSGDEEVSGSSAPEIVKYLEEKGIRPALVLDEGGAIVEGVFPGVDRPVAVVGTGEKGYLDLKLTFTGPGGHSSTPPAHSLVGQLSKAIINLEKRPFKAHLTPPVKELFTTLGRYSSFIYRIIFANLWCTWPLLKLVFTKQGGKMNALIRTTCAVTRLTGSEAYNVLPPKVSLGVNLRLMASDSVDQAQRYIKKSTGYPGISCRVVESREASPISSTDQPGWKRVKKAILANWPQVIVSPYLMLAATDSRHFHRISDCVLRFSPMALSDDDMKRIHGHDERISIDQLKSCVEFYKRMMQV